MSSSWIGRAFFGLALAGFGGLQLVDGDFVAGRAPAWPDGVPGRLAWAWISGALLIAVGAVVIAGKRARGPVIWTAALIFLWALLRQVPGVAANPHGAVLTGFGKALALSGGALGIAGTLPQETGWWTFGQRAGNATDGFVRIGRACLGAFLILGGVQHFIYPQFVLSLVPAWIPARPFWVYFAGVALIAGGAGLQLAKTVRWAATLSGLMIFLWVVLLHVPRAVAPLAPAQRRNEWTSVFEALAFSGIALAIAGFERARRPPRLPDADEMRR